MGANALSDIPMVKSGSVTFYVPATTASASDSEYAMWRAPWAMTLVNAYVTYDAAITGANTNTFTAKVMNRGTANAGTTVLASKAFTSGVNSAINVATALTNGATLSIAEGEVITYLSDQAGSGMNDTAHAVTIDYLLA